MQARFLRLHWRTCPWAEHSLLLLLLLLLLFRQAPWRKRLDARLPALRSRVRVSVTPCGFRGQRSWVWIAFPPGFSSFVLPQISFHHFSTLISFISFHPPLWWCVRRGRPASLLMTDLLWKGFHHISPSTWSLCRTRFERFIIIIIIIIIIKQ